MPEQCIFCSATLPEKSSCQTIHEELLNFEALSAIPHLVHFLHVTCFMIQHERYSNEALVWAQSMLRANLDEHMTEQRHLQHLRTVGKNNPSRTWKFNRAEDASPLPKIAWSLTIVDVAQQAHNVEQYCERVKQWAHSTLQQMASLLL